ncbi:MAG: hypothetical protein K2L59_09680 [Muribaculaceae bacterium]|nr:hypothetical protein [Muribaculaceae bacterium]
MKHLYAMLLAVGLAPLCATGQNVTVLMKDGTSHKFNADYLSELSFKEVPQGPETVEFTSVEVQPYSGGNVTLTFTNADGSVSCVTDLYGRPDSNWLKTGVYTVSGTNDAYTMDPAYSSVTVDNERKNITGGTVDVTLEGHLFTFDIDLTLEDNAQFLGTYTGELDKYTQWITAEMTSASYNSNPQPAGDFYVKFNDAAWNYEMAIVFTAAASETELPAGTYTYSDVRMPATVSPASYVDIYSPYATLRLAPGSKVSVAREGSVYTIGMNLVLSDGRTAEFTFEGEISGTPSFDDPEPEPDPVVFDMLDVNPYGGGNTGLTFNLSSDSTIALSLDCYGSASATYFETGEYVVGNSGSLYIDTDVRYTFLARDGNTTAVASGNMNVSRDGGVYTFEIDLTLADGSRLKGTYEGRLNKFTPVAEYTVTKAAYNENARPAGNFYVKFNDDSWNCSVAMDFHASPAAQTLPAGTYVYGEDSSEGTIGRLSYIETNTTYYVKEGTRAVVAVDGDVYDITMTIVKEDGTEAIVTFNGQITGTPVFE